MAWVITYRYVTEACVDSLHRLCVVTYVPVMRGNPSNITSIERENHRKVISNKRINLDNITSNEWGNPDIITSNDMINPGNRTSNEGESRYYNQ